MIVSGKSNFDNVTKVDHQGLDYQQQQQDLLNSRRRRRRSNYNNNHHHDDIDSSSSEEDDDDTHESDSEGDEENELLLSPAPQSWFGDNDNSINDNDEASVADEDNDNDGGGHNVHEIECEDSSVTSNKLDHAPANSGGNSSMLPQTVSLPPLTITTITDDCNVTRASASVGVNTLVNIKPAPSVKEITTKFIPAMAKEILTTSLRRLYYYTNKSYYKTIKYYSNVNHTEYGNHYLSGYTMPNTMSSSSNQQLQLHIGQINIGQQSRANLHSDKSSAALDINNIHLPPFSSLPWIDRQLVKEWRTCDYILEDETNKNLNRIYNSSFNRKSSRNRKKEKLVKKSGNQNDIANSSKNEENNDDFQSCCAEANNNDATLANASNDSEAPEPPLAIQGSDDENGIDISDIDDDFDLTDNNDGFDIENDDFYDMARVIKPKPIMQPIWLKSKYCYKCKKNFGPALLRHHCRLCGYSFCQEHSSQSHYIPFLISNSNNSTVSNSSLSSKAKSNDNAHSDVSHPAIVPERVCDTCKDLLVKQNLYERIAWRLARCRDYLSDPNALIPYFETGVDTLEDIAIRLTQITIEVTKKIPFLGVQAHVAVETIDVLRKYGLKGIYGFILRKEFLDAANLLCKAVGINSKTFPLSVHELSAAIFYALAQHRALRGMNPDHEHIIHTYKKQQKHEKRRREATAEYSTNKNIIGNDDKLEEEWSPFISANVSKRMYNTARNNNSAFDATLGKSQSTSSSLLDNTDSYNPMQDSIAELIAMADDAIQQQQQNGSTVNSSPHNDDVSCSRLSTPNAKDSDYPNTRSLHNPVCEHVPDEAVSSLLLYAPIALNFVYAEKEVDMQLLAAQQGWRLLYAHLQQDTLDRPASAIFINEQQKIVAFAVRGTATINDIVTDIQQIPVPFPEEDISFSNNMDDSETKKKNGQVKQDNFSFEDNGNIAFSCDEDVDDDGWTPVFRGEGLAFSGMAKAAMNLYKEHIDVLLLLAENGYRIRVTGHSLGGGVATLLGTLVLRRIEQKISSLHTKKSENENHVQDSDEDEPCDSVVNDSFENDQIVNLERNDILRVYAYGTPACVDAKLSDFARSFVTTVVLHDDVVPRLTPTSTRGLLKHLLHIRETWVKAHLTNDLMAITERAKTVWAPRWRGSFTISKLNSLSVKNKASFKRYCKKQIQNGKKKFLTVKGQIVGSSFTSCHSTVKDETGKEKSAEADFNCGPDTLQLTELDSPANGNTLICPGDGDVDNKHTSCTTSNVECQNGIDEGRHASNDKSNGGPKLVLDYMGGIDYRSEGVVVDGDEFFDAEDSLLLEEDDGEVFPNGIHGGKFGRNGNGEYLTSITNQQHIDEELIKYDYLDDMKESNENTDDFIESEVAPQSVLHRDQNGNSAHPETNVHGSLNGRDSKNFGSESYEALEEDMDEACAVILDEAPLPRMFLPGKIVHIYTFRGGYKCAYVPRAFRELRRVSLAGNMLNDHTSKSYYESLLEVQSIRKAKESLPCWTAFDEDDTCSCCASRFTWASTSDSEAQEARDKHNCRSCGSLVCHPCSRNRIPLPSTGITVPVRVCDRCYNNIGGVLSGLSGNALTDSYIEDSNENDDSQESDE